MTISVSPAGRIGRGTSVVKAYFRGKKYIELYYEKKGRKIGLKPLGRRTPDSLVVRFDKSGKVGQVMARGFFNQFGIKVGALAKVPVRYVGRVKLLSADLGKSSATRRRGKRTRKTRKAKGK